MVGFRFAPTTLRSLMFALTVREWLENATYKNYLTLILVRQCRWRKMMYSHLEEMLEQKKQSLLTMVRTVFLPENEIL